jgi:hypothetical protein
VGELDVAASYLWQGGEDVLARAAALYAKTSLGRALSMLLAFFYCEKATFHALMKNSCPIRMVKLALACYVSWLGMSHARCSVFGCLCMSSLSCISEAQWIEPIKVYDDKRRSSCVPFG